MVVSFQPVTVAPRLLRAVVGSTQAYISHEGPFAHALQVSVSAFGLLLLSLFRLVCRLLPVCAGVFL